MDSVRRLLWAWPDVVAFSGGALSTEKSPNILVSNQTSCLRGETERKAMNSLQTSTGISLGPPDVHLGTAAPSDMLITTFIQWR